MYVAALNHLLNENYSVFWTSDIAWVQHKWFDMVMFVQEERSKEIFGFREYQNIWRPRVRKTLIVCAKKEPWHKNNLVFLQRISDISYLTISLEMSPKMFLSVLNSHMENNILMVRSPIMREIPPFTQREQDALSFYREGHPIKKIAEKMGLTENTVRGMFRRMCRRLGLQKIHLLLNHTSLPS